MTKQVTLTPIPGGEGWNEDVERMASDIGLPPGLGSSVMKHESGGRANAVSKKGAVGPFQLMEGAAKDVGVNRNNYWDNIKGGLLYLKKQLDSFGDVDTALAAYNAGPGTVKTYGGIPPYKETQKYVSDVKGTMQNLLGGQPTGGRQVTLTPMSGPEGVDFSFETMAKNAIPSAVDMFKNMIKAVVDVDKEGKIKWTLDETGKNLGMTALGFIEKLIPGDQEHEKYADLMVGFLTDRYGSWDKIKQTLMQDPAGVATDLSTIFGGLGGVAQMSKLSWLQKLGQGLSYTSKVVNPITAPIEAAGAVRAGLGATKIPEWLYGTAMKIPPGSVAAEVRDSILHTLVREEKLPLNRGTRAEMNRRIGSLDEKISSLLDEYSSAGKEIKADEIVQALNNLKLEYKNRPGAVEIYAAIDEVKDKFLQHEFWRQKAITTNSMAPSILLDSSGKPFMVPSPRTTLSADSISWKDAWNLKKGTWADLETYFQKGAKPESGRSGMKGWEDASAYARAARTIRDSIVNSPDIPDTLRVALMKEKGLMEARKWVERAANRGANLDPMSLGSLAFGILTDNGLPATIAYKVVMSQNVMSRLSLWMANGSKALSKAESLALPITNSLFQGGRLPFPGGQE